MWLLNTQTYRLQQFTLKEAKAERYAILSHCWNKHEITFADVKGCTLRARIRPGWDKVKNACAVARRLGRDRWENAPPYKWIWDDTCCIDKSSSAELSEAINSMFSWYRNATVCLIYLGDVPMGEDPWNRHSSFRKSRWFKRGWTLQELIASDRNAIFLSSEWTYIGDCYGLAPVIEEITGVDCAMLKTWHSDGRIEAVYGTSIAKRMSWAAGRETTRDEDRAYSLMGLFDVHMPIIYGEGGEKAFRRLQLKVIKRSTDHSIFAYGEFVTGKETLPPPPPLPLKSSDLGTRQTTSINYWTLGSSTFPSASPDLFQCITARTIEPVPLETLPGLLNLSPPSDLHYVPTNRGVRIALPVACVDENRNIYVALLALRPGQASDGLVGMLLRRQEDSDAAYQRLAGRHVTQLKRNFAATQRNPTR
ncbi:heterokaryon incompatibility protein-domain-containing protein [Trametes meyenii]|nr:heterokaryon incompatibility protein-domain-containing protein [Trametes meyenii]